MSSISAISMMGTSLQTINHVHVHVGINVALGVSLQVDILIPTGNNELHIMLLSMKIVEKQGYSDYSKFCNINIGCCF